MTVGLSGGCRRFRRGARRSRGPARGARSVGGHEIARGAAVRRSAL